MLFKTYMPFGFNLLSRIPQFLGIALLFGATSLHAQTPDTSTFTAQRGDWFDGVNWSSGTFPGTNTDAHLIGATVRLNARGTLEPFVIKSLTLNDGAELELRDVRLHAEMIAATNSLLRIYNSHLVVGTLRDPGFGNNGMRLNPSLIEAEVFELVETNVTVSFGIGGTNPATASGLGAGHFAQVIAAAGYLDGNLDIEFLYGFQPEAGQTFPIIVWTVPLSAGSHGQFANAPEGALVARYNDLGLYITYLGGDGDDVVLTVQTLPVGTAPLVRATQDGDWFSPSNWSDGQVPTATKEHILLARQISMQSTTPGQSVNVKSITLLDGSELIISNLTLNAELIAATNSLLNIFNSHLVVGTLRDPGFGNNGLKLNPSLIEAEVFELVETNVTVSFGIGGTNPATASGLGAGHFAQVIAAAGYLDGNLDIEFLYGFQPEAGQTFPIIVWTVPLSAGSHGQFANAPEGALVARYNDLGLYITYLGGDGDDVVLTVQTLPVGTAPLVRAVQDGDWFSPSNWSDGQVPTATREHILLARQISMQSTTPGQSVNVKSITLLDGSELIISNLTLNAETIAATNSFLRIFNSHLVVDTLRDPGFGSSGLKFNPSLIEAQVFEVVEAHTAVTFGIGGTNPAAVNALGAGNYARVVTDTASLDGILEVEFLYGFTPQVGQQFEIITVNTPNGPNSGLTGRFANVREGGVAAVFEDVMLVLSYVGGDGNDVVLTAVPGLTISAVKQDAETLILSFDTANAHFYNLETRTNLSVGAWNSLPAIFGTGAVVSVTNNFTNGPAEFFQLSRY